ncbi:hypothetical protein F5Y16DRAFT_408127 [Xylariaceae sp. FL0255]|nr:hypothetical protein F5Y16DRAFT_408127 [Xylariaceae sp. FL0255]
MADGLSIAASVAGLVALADAVFRSAYKYCKTASEAGNEIRELIRQIQSLSGVLHSLKILIDALDQEGSQGAIQLSHITDASKILGEIQGRLSKAVMKLGGPRSSIVQESLKWPFTKSKTKELADKLSKQYEIINAALNAESLAKLMELLNKNKELTNQLVVIQKGVNNLQDLIKVNIDTHRQRVLDFFLKVNPQPHLDTSIRLRHPGTGTWLLHSTQFQRWIETGGSKMWLSGIPGAGKTIIAGAVIQEALKRGKAMSKVGVAFFFCDYKDMNTANSSNILCALASQLARQSDDAFGVLNQVYVSLHPPDGLAREPDLDIAQDLLEKLFYTGEITQTLSDIADYADNVTISLSSRHEEVRIGARKEDLLLYVAAELEKRIEDGRLRIADMGLKDEVLDLLADKAQGMFRWVTCQLDYLCHCVTDFDRRNALKELPPTLDNTYERMLDRIADGHPRARLIAQKCLQLIANNSIHLPIEELCHAVSVMDIINVELDRHAVVSEHEITRQCSSFVRKSEDGRFFEFSHFSVREFFRRDTLRSNPKYADFYITEATSDATMATQCLLYIQLKNFCRIPDPDFQEEVEYAAKIRNDFPFYYTATFRWLACLRTANSPTVWDLARSLFNPRKSPQFVFWAVTLCNSFSKNQEMSESQDISQVVKLLTHRNFNTTHFAALLGLTEICDHLLQVHPSGNCISPIGTALECHLAGIFCLPGIDALVDNDCRNFKPLRQARNRSSITSAHETTMGKSQPFQVNEQTNLLVTRAIYCATAFLDFSPLAYLLNAGWAISEEEADTFESFMSHVPRDIDLGLYHLTPHEVEVDVPESLLQLVNALQSSRSWKTNAGLRACIIVWNTAIELEYPFSKDTSLMDTRVTLSLKSLVQLCHVAIENDDTETLGKCLSDGRISGPENDDDGTDTCGYTLLRQAIYDGSVKTARYMIDCGYGLDKPSPSQDLPIHEAWDQEIEMLRLLLGSGASQLDRNSEGNTIWHIAAFEFTDETIQALLELSGSREALRTKNEEGFTPLTLFIQEMAKYELKYSTKTMELLLANCKGDARFWSSPVSIWDLATKSNSARILMALAEANIPIDLPDGQPTPLHSLRPTATRELVALVKSLFPNATNLLFDNQLPAEAFIIQCIKLGRNPHDGVLEELIDQSALTVHEQRHVTIWEYFCQKIIDGMDEARLAPLTIANLLPRLFHLNVMEAHEESKNTCAAIACPSSGL